MCDECKDWKAHADVLQKQVNILSEGYDRQREELERCGEQLFVLTRDNNRLNNELEAAWAQIETLNKA